MSYVDRLRLSETKLQKFRQVAGLRGLRVRLDSTFPDPDTIFDVRLSDDRAEIAVNGSAMAAELRNGRRKVQVAQKALARELDRGLKLELFKVAISRKWDDIKKHGIGEIGNAAGSLLRAAVFLMDDRRLITARRQPA